MEFNTSKVFFTGFLIFYSLLGASQNSFVRSEVVRPIVKKEFRSDSCKQRVQGGDPRIKNEMLVFDGAQDGNRQVDPQIAVGGGYVLHATNLGLIIYDKKGNYIDGVSQNCFNKGIDPKLFYDPVNKIYAFDLWNPWDEEKKKPVNIAVSTSNNPTEGWNIYPIPAPEGRDGGGIGFSKEWIGYSFPGGDQNTFVLRMKDAKKGKPAKVYHFQGSLGQPVFTQDPLDDLYFFKIEGEDFTISKVTEDDNNEPIAVKVISFPHNMGNLEYPPKSPQKNTDQLTSSGDKNPKNIVLQNQCLWFSQAINYKGRSAIRWYQVSLKGEILQTGLISDPNTNYIQTTIGVNKNNDVLIGFQETNKNMFISPRMAYRKHDDPKGEVRGIISLGEGRGATDGTSWGDYSGTVIDGDNLKDLWTIQSITNEKGKGETVIAKLPFQ